MASDYEFGALTWDAADNTVQVEGPSFGVPTHELTDAWIAQLQAALDDGCETVTTLPLQRPGKALVLLRRKVGAGQYAMPWS